MTRDSAENEERGLEFIVRDKQERYVPTCQEHVLKA